MPGCPPPLINIFTQETLGGAAAPPCAFRSGVPERINNLAVPSAAIIDAFDHFNMDSDPNTLTTILLGGRTPVQVAGDIRPTFVSVALGSNDILGALLDGANPGDTSKVTDPATFAARYAEALDSLEAIGSIEGGVLIGIQPIFVDPTTGTLSAPYFTAGAAWMQFEAYFDGQTAPLNFFDVDAACATAFVPFPFGAPVLGAANAKLDSVMGGTLAPGAVVPAALSCADNVAITATEFANVAAAQAQYNAAIQAEAADRGWAYFDPAPVFAAMAATPGAFRPFPAFDPADPQHVSQPFGAAISIDGIHWSAALQQAIADALIDAINDEYDTDL
jgi:hypothetical protein